MVNTTSQDDFDSLRERLEQLPAELYDMVYVAVFTASPGVRNMTNGDGVAIKLLQISHNSRALYAQSYYGPGTDFVFTDDTAGCCLTMLSWAQTLPTAHLSLVDRISVIIMDGEGDPDEIMGDGGYLKHRMKNYYNMGHIISKCVFLEISIGVAEEDDYPEEGVYYFGLKRRTKFLKWADDSNVVELKRLSGILPSHLTREDTTKLQCLQAWFRRFDAKSYERRVW